MYSVHKQVLDNGQTSRMFVAGMTYLSGNLKYMANISTQTISYQTTNGAAETDLNNFPFSCFISPGVLRKLLPL